MSRVTTLNYAFFDAKEFNSDLSKWTTEPESQPVRNEYTVKIWSESIHPNGGYRLMLNHFWIADIDSGQFINVEDPGEPSNPANRLTDGRKINSYMTENDPYVLYFNSSHDVVNMTIRSQFPASSTNVYYLRLSVEKNSIDKEIFRSEPINIRQFDEYDIDGNVPGPNESPWASVDQDGNPTEFWGLKTLTVDLRDICSSLTNLYHTFWHAYRFNSDLSKWSVSDVTTMSSST